MQPIDLLDMAIDFSNEKKEQGFKLVKSSIDDGMMVFDNGTETLVYSWGEIINHYRLKKLKRLINDNNKE